MTTQNRGPITATTKALVVNPSLLLAEMLTTTLASEGIDVVGRYTAVDDAIVNLPRLCPDVLVVGGIPVGALEEVAALSHDLDAGVRVLVVADADDSQALHDAMGLGVSGFITSACTPAQLADAVQRVAGGEVVVLGVQGRLASRNGGKHEPSPLVELTQREREILRLVCAGRSNAEIAKELFISQHTVRTHVQNIRSKLNVRSKLQAALLAVNAVDAGEPGETRSLPVRRNGNGAAPLRPALVGRA